MTDDEKKALIIGGAVVIIGGAIWLLRNQGQTIAPLADGVQAAPAVGAAPGYTTYNVAPYSAKPAATLGTLTPYEMTGGCGCGGGDGCFTAGGTNTPNAPTSLTQLLNWYASKNPNFGNIANQQVQAYNFPASTIMEQTGPTALSNSPLY